MPLSALLVHMVVFLALQPAPDELVFADGRRAPVENPRKDSKGDWVGTLEGRRTALNPGEVVAIVGPKGDETLILPELIDGAATVEETAQLASLRDLKNEAWQGSLAQLDRRPTRGLHDALVAMSAAKQSQLRSRAISALCALHTKVSVLAAGDAILALKDAGARRELASVLFSVQEIFRRSECLTSLERGLADTDVGVRLVFASISPRDHAASAAILKSQGLTHRDHHVRESSALELALRGDDAGLSILLSMLARTRIPGVSGDDELAERMRVEEQVRVCNVLGTLRSKNPAAKTALEKARESPREPVRKAAQTALEKLAG